jgi:hypothetical protein
MDFMKKMPKAAKTAKALKRGIFAVAGISAVKKAANIKTPKTKEALKRVIGAGAGGAGKRAADLMKKKKKQQSTWYSKSGGYGRV